MVCIDVANASPYVPFYEIIEMFELYYLYLSFNYSILNNNRIDIHENV